MRLGTLQCTACICRRVEFYEAARLRLGHDPLREDADAEALWEKVQVSKKPVGGILMDQTMIAGVGNIYRAEILFKVGPTLLLCSAACCSHWGAASHT